MTKTLRLSHVDMIKQAEIMASEAQLNEMNRWLQFPIWKIFTIRSVENKTVICLKANISGGMLMAIYPNGKSEANQQGENKLTFNKKLLNS